MRHSQTSHINIEPASVRDAENLAKLIDIAGEGIPAWLWSEYATQTQSALQIGTERARRESGGFSYRNAQVARAEPDMFGMVLSYPIDEAPEGSPDNLPAPIAPFVALEHHSVGTWYINALAVFPGYRACGIGSALLHATETQAQEAGYQHMTIQVYAQNTGAVRLYAKLGYSEVARAPVREHPCQPYYTGDVLLLKKQVS